MIEWVDCDLVDSRFSGRAAEATIELEITGRELGKLVEVGKKKRCATFNGASPR